MQTLKFHLTWYLYPFFKWTVHLVSLHLKIEFCWDFFYLKSCHLLQPFYRLCKGERGVRVETSVKSSQIPFSRQLFHFSRPPSAAPWKLSGSNCLQMRVITWTHYGVSPHPLKTSYLFWIHPVWALLAVMLFFCFVLFWKGKCIHHHMAAGGPILSSYINSKTGSFVAGLTCFKWPNYYFFKSEKRINSGTGRLDSGLFHMWKYIRYKMTICQCVCGLSRQVKYSLALRVVRYWKCHLLLRTCGR